MRSTKKQYHVNIDGKKYQVPRSWEDISIQQYLDLRKSNPANTIETIAILLKCPYGVIHRTKLIDIEEIIFPFTAFLNGQPLIDKELPPIRKVTITGVKYDAPKDLKTYSYGQRIYAETKINEAAKEHQDVHFAMHKVIACYFYPIVFDRPFDEDEPKFEQFEKEVLDNVNVLEGIEVFNFFLHKLKILQQRKKLPYPLNLIRNKWLRGFINWTYSRRSTRLMNSQGVIF